MSGLKIPQGQIISLRYKLILTIKPQSMVTKETISCVAPDWVKQISTLFMSSATESQAIYINALIKNHLLCSTVDLATGTLAIGRKKIPKLKLQIIYNYFSECPEKN